MFCQKQCNAPLYNQNVDHPENINSILNLKVRNSSDIKKSNFSKKVPVVSANLPYRMRTVS